MLPRPFRQFALLPFAAGLLLLAGCGKTDTTGQEAAASPAPAPLTIQKSVTPNSFAEVTEQLDAGGDFFLYLNTAQWLGRITHGMDEVHDMVLSGSAGVQVTDRAEAEKTYALVRDIIFKSGIEQVSGVGASSLAIAPGLYRNKFFIHHDADKGDGLLWAIHGRTPHQLAGLDFLPPDTAIAVVRDFDLAQLLNFLRAEVRNSGVPEAQNAFDQWQTQFSGATGLPLDDVLASLNGSLGGVITLDATSTIAIPAGNQPVIPTPRIALLLGVKNDLIFKQIDKMAGINPGVIKVDEPGLQMRTMPVPMVPALNLRPTVAQWNGYLVIASDDKLVRDMAAALKDGHGFKSTPEFAALSSGMPAEGNGFAIMTQRFAETLRQLQSEMVSNQPGVNANQSAFVRQVFARYQKTGHMYSVGTQLPNGLLSVSQGSQGSSQLLAPLIIAPVAIAAAVSVPAAEAAQKRAIEAQSLARAKQLLLACKQYAIDNNGNLPASLDDLFPTYLSDRTMLASPLDPTDPEGYIYTPGFKAGDPGASVVIEDKFAPQLRQVQIVVHLDGSGRIIRMR
jgi:hypothetical protein